MNEKDKGFESKIKGMYSGIGCACQSGVLEKKKTSLKEVVCKKCGETFKTNKDTKYCFKCRKKM